MSLEFARDWFDMEVDLYERKLTAAEKDLAWEFFRKGRECMGADATASPKEAVRRERRSVPDDPDYYPRCPICGVVLSRCRCERRTGDGA